MSAGPCVGRRGGGPARPVAPSPHGARSSPARRAGGDRPRCADPRDGAGQPGAAQGGGRQL